MNSNNNMNTDKTKSIIEYLNEQLTKSKLDLHLLTTEKNILIVNGHGDLICWIYEPTVRYLNDDYIKTTKEFSKLKNSAKDYIRQLHNTIRIIEREGDLVLW